MLFVTTSGVGSMDLYAEALAMQMPHVRRLETDVYERSARRFNLPLIGPGAFRSMAADLRFVRRLRAVDEPIHFPNHHLARYGLFLRVPYIVTVHDLIRYFDLRRYRPLIQRPNARDRVYLGLDYAGIRRAAAVIAVSQTTKADLVEQLGLPESRVHVVYEGIDHRRFRPVDARPFEFPYVLYVGSEQPRKNLGMLLQAFARLKQAGAHPSLRLVKVGAAGGPASRFREDTLRLVHKHGLDEDVILVDRVHPEVLPAYYAGASCTVIPSLYEGFGFPALEAMACGSPVIASSGGSLPEIVRDAALLVSPRDPEALATAIDRVLRDGVLRDSLRVRGLQRAAQFRWDAAARDTLRVYQAVEQETGTPVASPVAMSSRARGMRAALLRRSV